ncbi:MAG: NAD(P)H-dependent oxidoreductase [Desulfatiglandales bacterium]
MKIRQATILDGTNSNDLRGSQIRERLIEAYDSAGYSVIVHRMEEIKIAHCIGCFGCWVKTPGECIHKDAGRQIAKEILNSHTVVLLSPVVFGGYSAALKHMVDRFIPLIHPNLMMRYGEIHHRSRYTGYPRMVGIGLQQEHDEKLAYIFKTLVGRNAINFHCPSYAAEVLHGGVDDDLLQKKIKEMVTRKDPVPEKRLVASMMAGLIQGDTRGDTTDFEPTRTRRALLLVGSPKRGASTSEVLGGYLLRCLEEMGWSTKTLKLRSRVFRDEGLKELFSLVDQADLIVPAFPLYVDSLPALVTQALEVLSAGWRDLTESRPRRLFPIVNNGFPEAYQNAPALAICGNFAEKTGMVWAGSLALGAGEALVCGRSLGEKKPNGLPVFHVIHALRESASMLDQKGRVSCAPGKSLERTPFPMMPFFLWRRMCIPFAASGWKKQASQHGIEPRQMNARPYAQ